MESLYDHIVLSSMCQELKTIFSEIDNIETVYRIIISKLQQTAEQYLWIGTLIVKAKVYYTVVGQNLS